MGSDHQYLKKAIIDNETFIKAIKSGMVKGAALDVVEGETGIYYHNRKAVILQQRNMAILNAFPNVILSPYMAFLTDESNQDMVRHSVESCIAFIKRRMESMENCIKDCRNSYDLFFAFYANL